MGCTPRSLINNLVRSKSDSNSWSIPDTWETDNGLDPLDAQDATFDSDGDGLTSLQEYLQGKDPSSLMQERNLNNSMSLQ